MLSVLAGMLSDLGDEVGSWLLLALIDFMGGLWGVSACILTTKLKQENKYLLMKDTWAFHKQAPKR